jgi:regulation of enolase protein 1 (concanavalin A-like superfamily)
VGRDFTIRGESDNKRITTIRVREYLAGNAIYKAAVVSAPNQELPNDTGKFLDSLEIAGVRTEGAATATPTPEQKTNELPGWGLAIDPQSDCEFTPEKNRLTMKITGSKHQMPVQKPNLNSPRVMREVEGDFTLTVKVVGEFSPGGKSTNPKSVPWHGAGIIVWNDEDNYIRLERSASNRNGKIAPYVNFEEFEGGAHGLTNSEGMKEGDCWIRMERKGGRFLGSVSFDNATWKELKPMQVVWPMKLKIGLQTTTTSSLLPWSVVFEDYELKTQGK